ncbi:hypothetical protein ABK905_20350 [Acerihabitans sp. KWT182]|uniref:Uncharacterized protein n=1 Tax=Acerihabitans sp. KWT182 TaxID=3157919 RepID=A0AAU7Q6W5_9GAMM
MKHKHHHQFIGYINMCHYQLTGESSLGPVEVLLGWNSTFSFFYMFIELSYRPPLYSCLHDKDVGNDVLEHYQNVLDSFGINNINLKRGSELYDNLLLDCIRVTLARDAEA